MLSQAGTIAAIGGNQEGVVGVNPTGGIELHIVNFFDAEGSTFGSDFMQAVQYCVQGGANIVSMSLGGPMYLSYEDDIFQQYYDEGVLFVASAGNDGINEYNYPASYDSVISVAAVDSYKNRAYFSQFNNRVELAAPGVDILSTFPGASYEYLAGTSMACPHVSGRFASFLVLFHRSTSLEHPQLTVLFFSCKGVAALVWSLYPNRSAQDIRAALANSAEDLGATGRDPDYGYGLVRADLAVEYLAANTGPIDEPGPTEPIDPPDCVDDPPGWADRDGDDCSWYGATSTRCDTFGSGWADAVYGQVAQEACCVCGGGTTDCVDVEGWVDSDGDGCDFYDEFNCMLFGDWFENEGHTASTACCACQGVTATSIASTTKDGAPQDVSGTTAFEDEYLQEVSGTSATSLGLFALTFVLIILT